VWVHENDGRKSCKKLPSVKQNTPLGYTHTRFNSPLSRTSQVSRYQKGKTNLDFSEARDSAWQWHQLGCMQVCISLQTNNHAGTPPLGFSQAGCPSCRPTNSVKALKATVLGYTWLKSRSSKYLVQIVHVPLFPVPPCTALYCH